jgi:hypothetical protein
MDRKTINIDLESLSMKKKSSTRNKTSSQKKKDDLEIKPSNVRQLLLEKLKEYKKKHKTMKAVSEKSHNPYEEYLEKVDKTKESDAQQVHVDIKDNTPKPQPPYSNMKNSTIPTFRSYMKNITQKNLPPPQFRSLEKTQETSIPKQVKSMIKRKFTLGKSPTKKIGIMITSQKTRKNIEDFKIENKKENLKTIKNYLKKHNMIHHGTTCPALLLREIYENSRLCGTVQNTNGKKLIDNYLNDEKS